MDEKEFFNEKQKLVDEYLKTHDIYNKQNTDMYNLHEWSINIRVHYLTNDDIDEDPLERFRFK